MENNTNSKNAINDNKNTKHIRASSLEKLIVNWATPLEGRFFWPVVKAGFELKGEFQKYVNEYGVFVGIYKSKVKDYERLLNSDKSKSMPDKVIELYNGTPCGRVMIKTYNVLRK